MAHHHKTNRAVEGNPDDGHGRGIPLRPDEEELKERTEEDRRDVGLPEKKQEDPATQYEEAQAEIDQEVDRGEMPTGTTPREKRESFPPTDYES
ncbi:hypothetical protein [Streptomyces sp. NPDC048473]|uniref:hypothetical protein n=1 Tax=unclassified Streptomyces TaxID=2593676 RepID=UPI003713202C